MKRLLLPLFFVALVNFARGGSIYTSPLDTHQIRLDCRPHGVSGTALKQYYHAKHVYPANYFTFRKQDGRYYAVDYLMIRRKVLHPYRKDLGRPIIYLDPTLNRLEIFSSLSSFQKAVPQPGVTACAFAANYTVTCPDRTCDRPFLATKTVLRGKKRCRAVVYGYVTGTREHALACERNLKRQYHLDAFAWLDGGSSFSMTRSLPFHLVFG